MVMIKCPKCRVAIDSENSTPEDLLDWRTNDKGEVVWNCMECEHEWIGGFLG